MAHELMARTGQRTVHELLAVHSFSKLAAPEVREAGETVPLGFQI